MLVQYAVFVRMMHVAGRITHVIWQLPGYYLPYILGSNDYTICRIDENTRKFPVRKVMTRDRTLGHYMREIMLFYSLSLSLSQAVVMRSKEAACIVFYTTLQTTGFIILVYRCGVIRTFGISL